ncbi:MAG: hypothetical protein WBF77_11395 [Sulfurimonadaceae bacterium]
MHTFKRELLIYLGIFIFLAAGMHHKAWLTHPLVHIQSLPESDFGIFHPLFFTLGAYLFVAIIRVVFALFARLFQRKY